jgi:Protein of unknown function (DUF4197)
MGAGAKVDEFEHSMNAAAEAAAPAAKAIFMDALKAMSFDDARQIVMGGNTAGTEYFKRTTSAQVSQAFRPIIEREMAKTGVSGKFEALMESAPQMPFTKTPTIDINGYVLEKSVDGMFTMMGQEEARIRTNPAAQVTSLLKTVFGRHQSEDVEELCGNLRRNPGDLKNIRSGVGGDRNFGARLFGSGNPEAGIDVREYAVTKFYLGQARLIRLGECAG